jgi:hypothetical protein
MSYHSADAEASREIDEEIAANTAEAANTALIPRPIRVIVADSEGTVLDSWDVTQQGADLGPTRNARAAILTVSATIR